MNKEPALAKAVSSDSDGSILRVVECFNTAIDVIRKEYMRKHNDPWVVAYSGEKTQHYYCR